MFSILFVAAVLVVGKSAAIEIDMNYTAAPDLHDFSVKVQATLLVWYPQLAEKLNSPTFRPIEYVSITFDPNYDGVAYAYAGGIVGAVDYYRTHQDDVGSMIHELVHIIQGYQNGPGWVTEGIADYIRYFIYEPDRQPGKPGPGSHYTNGYGVTAYFLNYVLAKYNFSPDFVYWLNKDCREGQYADSIWERMLGKTADQLWDEMMNPPPLRIEIDYSDAPDLETFARNTNATLNEWYPIMAEALNSPNFIQVDYIKITFDGSYDGVAYAAGNQIVGGVGYYRSHQDDLGSMVHEMIHVIQGYRSGPGWLVEGIADYWRWYHYEDSSKPRPSKPGAGSSYTDGYKTTAFFLNYVQNTYGDVLYWLNKDCREGTYADTIWGKLLPGKTVDILWAEMMERA